MECMCLYVHVCVCAHACVHKCLFLNHLSLNSDQVLYCQYIAYRARKKDVYEGCEPYNAWYN
jgi:hypothetical protein